MRKTLTLIHLAACLFLPSALAHSGDIAIIVDKANTTHQVSFSGLVKIFKLEQRYWKDGKKIYLVMQESGSREKDISLQKIYIMKDEELKKFWLEKIFREEISSFPRTLSSNEAVKRFVSQVPGSIGFIDASIMDETVKVLRIDGKLPGEPGYVLGGP